MLGVHSFFSILNKGVHWVQDPIGNMTDTASETKSNSFCVCITIMHMYKVLSTWFWNCIHCCIYFEVSWPHRCFWLRVKAQQSNVHSWDKTYFDILYDQVRFRLLIINKWNYAKNLLIINKWMYTNTYRP